MIRAAAIFVTPKRRNRCSRTSGWCMWSAATRRPRARTCCRFFEKYDGLLWYPSHYEGFESSEHVVYTGAAPNQHIVPLAEWLLSHCGNSAFFIGSNYIWAWENNKIMREAVQVAGRRRACRALSAGRRDRLLRTDRADPDRAPELRLQHADRRVGLRVLFASSARRFRLPVSISRASCRSQAAASPNRSWSRSGGEPPRAISVLRSISKVCLAVRTRPFSNATISAFPKPGRVAPMSRRPTSPFSCSHAPFALRVRLTWPWCEPRSPILAIDAPQGRVFVDPDNRHCYLTPRIGVFQPGFRLRPDLSSPRPDQARPLSRLERAEASDAPAALPEGGRMKRPPTTP